MAFVADNHQNTAYAHIAIAIMSSINSNKANNPKVAALMTGKLINRVMTESFFKKHRVFVLGLSRYFLKGVLNC